MYSAIIGYYYVNRGSVNYNLLYGAGFNVPEINMMSSFNHYNSSQIIINPANVDGISLNGTVVKK